MLNADQQAACDQFKAFFLDSSKKYFLLQGKPGTGKTHLTAKLIEEAENLHNFFQSMTNQNNPFEMYVTATTHKATQALAEHLNYAYDVVTIHSLLGLRVREDYKNGRTFFRQNR